MYFLLLGFLLKAQPLTVNQKVDSIKSILKTTKVDTIKIKCWRAWDILVYYNEPETDINLNNLIEKLCNIKLQKKTISKSEYYFYQKNLAFAYNNLGSIAQLKGNMQKSLWYMKQSLKINRTINHKEGIAGALGNLAITFSIMGDSKNALDYLLKGLKVQEELKDRMSIATSYNNIAVIYDNQKLYDLSLENYLKALKIRLEINDLKGVSSAYGNIASAYFKKGDLKKTLEYLNKGIDIAVKIDDKRSLGHLYENLGSYYEKKQDLKNAKKYFELAIEIRQILEDKMGESASYRSLGNIYFKLKNYKASLNAATKSLDLAKKSDAVLHIKEAAELLKKIYSQLGNYPKAFEMAELFTKMKDSLSNEDLRNTTLRQGIEYEYQKQKIADSIAYSKKKEIADIQLAKQKAEAEKATIAAKNSQIIGYALGGGLLLVLIFSYFLFKRFKITRLQKQIIEEKNKDILDSIHYAQHIQQSILPSISKFDETFNDYFILYLPKDVVSGDFYWLETVHTTVKTELKDKVSVLAVVDCTGHGVPGALMSVVGNTLLNQTIKNSDINSPAEALDFLNKELPKNLKKQNATDEIRDGMDLAMCAFDRLNNKLYFAGANNPLYFISNNELIEFKGDHQGISGANDFQKTNFTNHTIPIKENDCVYLLSDGFADQFGGKEGKKFKYKQLKEFIFAMHNLPMKAQRQKLVEKLAEWRGDLEQTDDILIIGVRI